MALPHYSKFLTFLSAVLVFSGSAVPNARADACTPITSAPYVISTPGKYCLTGPITFSALSGTAIEIQASNVELDLNGWGLYGPYSGGASSSALTEAIRANSMRNISIKNGTIEGFFDGIYIFGSNYINLAKNIKISRVALYDIVANPINFVYVSDVLLNENTLSYGPRKYTGTIGVSPTGIGFRYATGVRVTRNTITNAMDGGVQSVLTGVNIEMASASIEDNLFEAGVLWHYQNTQSSAIRVNNGTATIGSNKINSFYNAIRCVSSSAVYANNMAIFTKVSPYESGCTNGGGNYP